MASEFEKYRIPLYDVPGGQTSDYIKETQGRYNKLQQERGRFVHIPEQSTYTENQSLGRALIVLAGPVLSGKTTLAEALSIELGGVDIKDIDDGWRKRWGTLENRPKMPAVYEHNQNRTRLYHKRDQPVIMVATYSWSTYHELLRNFASEAQTPLRVFVLGIPDEKKETEFTARLEKRRNDPHNLSDITTPERVRELWSSYMPMPEYNDPNDPSIKVINIDSTQDPIENAQFIANFLSDLRKD